VDVEIKGPAATPAFFGSNTAGVVIPSRCEGPAFQPMSASLPVRYNSAMLMEADKVMFEIYRETAYTGKYRVVYFTELNEANKEFEINRALSGEHFYDGFIKNYRKEEAKDRIDGLLKRLNEGEKLTTADVERELAPYIPEASN
jgi:hypothetical protein